MSFDPDSFMQSTVDQPMETEVQMVPAGEYQAMIGDFDSSAFEQIEFTYKQGPNAGQPGTMTKFNCPFVITNDAKVKEVLGRDSATVFRQLILDVDASGNMVYGPNKNVNLGQIRAAVNQNTPGPWSVGNLRGAGPVMIKVDHTAGKRKDGSDWKRAEVTRVAPVR